jgi:lantibiotic modifying enzyme
MKWSPILTETDEALAVVDEIAAALRQGAPTGASLAGGSAGEALFFAYLDEALSRGAGEAEDRLGHAVALLAEQEMPPQLYAGFVGVAWAARHVLSRGHEPKDENDEEDANEEIDAAVQTVLLQTPWQRDYDLISGLVGLGVYALERLPRAAGARCLGLVIERLEELALPAAAGLTLWTPPELLLPETRAEFPRGYANVGLAHGVPGAVALLGAAIERGVAAERARRLLRGLVPWLLMQQLRDGGPGRFPNYVAPGYAPLPSRAAWCYGDPGIAVSLLWAARAAGEPAWEEAALRIAHAAARRTLRDAGVHDAGLCHGAAGLALIFHRLFWATGHDAFAETARSWYRETLALRRPGQGLAGYLTWRLRPEGACWQEDRGLLTGVAGIGLALLAGATAVEPRWDLALLTSLGGPGRPAGGAP